MIVVTIRILETVVTVMMAVTVVKIIQLFPRTTEVVSIHSGSRHGNTVDREVGQNHMHHQLLKQDLPRTT